jgi:hypothetical protein
MFRPNIGSPIVVYEDDSDLVTVAHGGYCWTAEGTHELIPAESAADHFGSCGREDIAECIRTRTAYIYGHREPF